MIKHLAPLALGLTLVAAPALAMGERPASPPPSQDPNAAASIADMEAVAGHILILGPRLTFQTDKGSFTVVTFPKEAPQTVEQIVKLAESGFYNGLTFHRVVPGFAIQGGDPASKKYPPGDPHIGKGGSGHPLPGEFEGQSDKFLTGTVGLARGKDADSGDSQFFVTLAPEEHLDGNYTVFGQVVSGMDTVRAIKLGDHIVKVMVSGVKKPAAEAPASAHP
jgi:cyclophilin family peptidyl-prolyl cis-trans isomerase